MDRPTRTISINDLVVSFRMPDGKGPHPVLLMLHGWTGSEQSMWIFSNRLPEDHLLIAPRGIFTAPLGGYGWHEYHKNGLPTVEEFYPAIGELYELLNVNYFPSGEFSEIKLTGFSQGAALAYVFALLYPHRVHSFAGLSGFLPNNVETIIEDLPLARKRGFVTHGKRDKLVPVARARYSVEILQQAGAIITYCEEDVGHKLSVNCFRGLEGFFSARPSPGALDRI